MMPITKRNKTICGQLDQWRIMLRREQNIASVSFSMGGLPRKTGLRPKITLPKLKFMEDDKPKP